MIAVTKKDKKRVKFYVDILEAMVHEYDASKGLNSFMIMLWLLTDYKYYIHDFKHDLNFTWTDHPISPEILDLATKKDKDAIRFITIVNSFSRLELPDGFKNQASFIYMDFVQHLGMINR